MRKSATDILKRWIALDHALKYPPDIQGMNPAKFATEWNVDFKTITRDLAAFKDLGYATIPGQGEGERFYRRMYQRGQRPMFSRNMSIKGEERPKAPRPPQP